MKMDFSKLNLAYLLHARDLAQKDPELVAALLGVSSELTHLLADVTPDELVHITQIRSPLLVLRQDPWWWQRLFRALRDGRQDELKVVIEHASLVVTPEAKGPEECP